MALQSTRYSVFLAGALALGACAGNGVVPAGGGAITPIVQTERSWMLPEARDEDLLYLSSLTGPDVYVYSYPKGKLIGRLGLQGAAGMCPDKKGHIWIADGATIIEYAHGGNHPIATLAAVGMSAVGCAIDPRSANLAVVGYPPSSRTPVVAIYRHAKGTPRVYDMPNSSTTSFCGYDDRGNLFVDGYGASPTSDITLAELLKGAASLKEVSFKSSGGFPSFYPTPIQWDGKYITVGAVHAINRYVVRNYIATYKSGTTFNEILELANSWIQGSKVVALNLFGSGSGSQIPAQMDRYPAGGNPIRIIDTKNLGNPFGVTVSLPSQ